MIEGALFSMLVLVLLVMMLLMRMLLVMLMLRMKVGCMVKLRTVGVRRARLRDVNGWRMSSMRRGVMAARRVVTPR